MFPIFTVVFVLSLLFAGRIAYLRKKEAREDSEFWEREKAANLTPKRDITNLPYINIPILALFLLKKQTSRCFAPCLVRRS